MHLLHLLHLLTLLPTILTVTALSASALKSVGQLVCTGHATNVYICMDTTHYAMCKSDYGVTNIYEVPAGMDWCKDAAPNYMGAYASAMSTAWDGKNGNWGIATPSTKPVPVTSTPGPGEDGMPTPTGHVAPPGA